MDILIPILGETVQISLMFDEVEAAMSDQNVDTLVMLHALLLIQQLHIVLVEIGEIRRDLDGNLIAVFFAKHDPVVWITDQDTAESADDACCLLPLTVFAQMGTASNLFQKMHGVMDMIGEHQFFLSAHMVQIVAPHTPYDTGCSIFMEGQKLVLGKIQRVQENDSILRIMLIDIFYGKVFRCGDTVWDVYSLGMHLLQYKQMLSRVKVQVELHNQVCID